MERLSQKAKRHLEQVIVPFWKDLRDDEFGGYYGFLSQDLELDRKAEKGCILHSRILWFFSEAAMLLGRDDLKAEADHTFLFIRNHCIDRKNGGIFWSMSFDGKPLDTTKHTYNQAFAIYALSAYYRLSKNEEALRLARELFELIEEHCTDEVGYLEAFTVDWRPESNEKLSENGVMAEKTMNTLLHVFEGYSGLYAAARDEKVEKAMRRILTIYTDKIWSPELKRQLVFFDKDYNSIIDLYSYGHDIESSWLMDWGTALLNDAALSKKVGDIGETMARATYENAYDHGSLANECDRGKKNETRVWWVQAEAVLGLVNLYSKCGEQKYADAAAAIYRFIEEKVVDKRAGSEWFSEVDKFGTPINDKPIVEPWKCPYHNGRMCMELIKKDPDIRA